MTKKIPKIEVGYFVKPCKNFQKQVGMSLDLDYNKMYIVTKCGPRDPFNPEGVKLVLLNEGPYRYKTLSQEWFGENIYPPTAASKILFDIKKD